uniref:Uncharacterized protein n=1 Tax=Fagus sylvatica TaxID=28930 RepID=A0A2N9H2M2_FAGSY
MIGKIGSYTVFMTPPSTPKPTVEQPVFDSRRRLWFLRLHQCSLHLNSLISLFSPPMTLLPGSLRMLSPKYRMYRNAEFACGYGAKLIFGSESGGLDNQGSWRFCESSTSFEMSFHGSGCGEGGENFWWWWWWRLMKELAAVMKMML